MAPAIAMSARGHWRRLLGSLLFFVVAPGTIAGWIPYRLTRWQMQPPYLPVPGLRAAGALLIAIGLASLVECFLRFALVGLGTPAPVAPPKELVVSGQYRYVRNPMYVAIMALLLGQSLLLGRTLLLRYAAGIWLMFHVWVLVYEEPSLKDRFGAAYDTYRRHVRRWWPRLRPWRGVPSPP
jgi:protein-S-isoprenylcysteine O-methyltransferase Ste14